MHLKAVIGALFEQYCLETPFAERSSSSWQLFAARSAQPITFNRHNYNVMKERYDVLEQSYAQERQRAGTTQASCARSACSIAFEL
jgi:hypothetical protein